MGRGFDGPYVNEGDALGASGIGAGATAAPEPWALAATAGTAGQVGAAGGVMGFGWGTRTGGISCCVPGASGRKSGPSDSSSSETNSPSVFPGSGCFACATATSGTGSL